MTGTATGGNSVIQIKHRLIHCVLYPRESWRFATVPAGEC